MKQGTLYFALVALRASSKDRLIPEAIYNQLDKALHRLKTELEVSEQILSAVHEDTIKGKLIYTLWRGKGSKHQLDKQYHTLKGACDKLKDLCLQLHTYRTAQSSYLLMSDVFKLCHETADNRPGELLPNSDILVASGNYVDRSKRITADFILEKKSRENDVRYLCEKLSRENLAQAHAILPVLGYRQPPYNEANGTKIFQMVFELPGNPTRESLSHWICTKPKPSVVDRLNLCLGIARGIESVHSLGFVHKSLRPRSVLIVSSMHARNPDTKIYLQDWTFVRELSGATTQLGEFVWQKAIYQHPERQGKYAEAVYEPKHDIYSLGVCILEVLLWKPFVRSASTTAARPEYVVCDLFESYGLARGEHNGGLPQRYRGDTVKLTSRPWVTKTIWLDIACMELGDYELAQIVLSCLEEGHGSTQEVVMYIEAMIKARTGL